MDREERDMGHKAGIRWRGLFLGAVAGVLLAAIAAAPASAEVPPPFWTKCPSGSAAGQCKIPIGTAVDPNTGHLYVADSNNNRIDEFTAWGVFERAWGWGVVASGPGNKPQNEIQQLSVDATAGSFRLEYNSPVEGSNGQNSGPIAFDASAAALQSALEQILYIGPGGVSVSGPPGGPWTIEFTDSASDTDFPLGNVVNSTLSGATATAALTTTQEGANFEACVPAQGDTCRAGQFGSKSGQLAIPHGLALDASGDLYVVNGDYTAQRVSKFDPTAGPSEEEVRFVLMFGGQVNKTKVEEGKPEAERNLCPIAPTDVCQAATKGTGNGQFGPFVFGSYIAPSPDGETIYVGDQERIQEFNTDGTYKGQIALPEAGTVGSLAVDPSSGDLYFSYASNVVSYPHPGAGKAKQPNVHRLDPGSGEEIGKPLEVAIPTGLATDPAGNVYALEAKHHEPNNPVPQFDAEVLKFDPAGKLIESFGKEEFEESRAIATSVACGVEGVSVYVSNAVLANSFVKAYGHRPDPALCPPPKFPPSIDAQYATSVGTDNAVLRAQINPHFWADTRYYVEYGTAKCTESACAKQPLPPGTTLKGAGVDEDVTSGGVVLSELQPDTTYRYRFVSESSGSEGEPVRGVGGTVGTDGEEGTFTTFPLALEPFIGCPNQAFRSGASAHLPDCRAYEMVSPVDKNNGDIAVLGGITRPSYPGELEQSSGDGDKLTYSSESAFGDAVSAPPTSQYIASREPGQGWSTHAISPRRESINTVNLDLEYRAFSEDLCSGWFFQEAEPVLAPGGVPGFFNIYRRENCGEGADSYEAITTVEPSGTAFYFPVLEGVSSDGTHAFFYATGGLAEGGNPKVEQLYESTGGALRLVCILPDGEPSAQRCSAGTYNGDAIGRLNTVARAVSEDGSRVFWTAFSTIDGPGPLYVRENPDQAESSRLHGSARGTGDLVGPVQAVGNLSKTTSPTTVKKVKVTGGGEFAVGQEITAPEGGIPAGTTIVKIEEPETATLTLTLSKAATATKTGAKLVGVASEVVSNVEVEHGAFAVGQEISAPHGGIPAETTIAAVEKVKSGPDVFKLTLSAKANVGEAGAALASTSECAEPDKACTAAISASEQTRFWTAASDGSKAIYTVGDSQDGKAALFEYDVEARESTKIAEGVFGVAGAGDDASHVYFASTEVLSEAANSEGDKAQEGEPNLYLYRAGEGGGAFTFIARLSSVDVSGASSLNAITPYPMKRALRVSPDGEHLAFPSSASLTGYDNTDLNSGKADTEAFLYDAASGRLACISCNPSGARPRGRDYEIRGKAQGQWAAANIPTWENQLYAPRALSNDGSRLFFESFEALVPRDANGAQDVYEWERAESGEECEEDGAELYVESSGGCLSLISSGQSPADSEFVDASPDGHDVFFKTAASLLPQDPGLIDLYDAREQGGFPQPLKAAECEGEACQAPPAPPNDPTPASSSFEGAGNVKEEGPAPAQARCPKGKVKRHGRCVAKKHLKRAKRRHGRTAR